MEIQISVVLADANEKFCSLLCDCITTSCNDVRIVGVAKNENELMDLATSLTPDFVILDISNEDLGGINTLKMLSDYQFEKKTAIIAIIPTGDDEILHLALLHKALYCFVKPFSIEVLIKRIQQLYHDFKTYSYFLDKSIFDRVKTTEDGVDLEVEVSKLILQLGISPHILGYKYLKEAVIQSNSSKLLNSVCKNLYSDIAKKFGTTPQKVKQDIRNAIDKSWRKGCSVEFSNYKCRPTNSEFIGVVLNKISS